MSIPVTISTSSIGRFFQHVRDAGIPDKINTTYLKSVSFKSSNDAALIGVLRHLKFIDASGAPTDRWRAYRSDESTARKVLGAAIVESYSGLFKTYPDAYRKDDEAIANWIRSNSDFAGITVTRAVKTFKALCSLADFSSDGSAPIPQPAVAQDSKRPAVFTPQSASVFPVNINIELQIPATNDPDVYDKFFAAMKKHLLNGNGS